MLNKGGEKKTVECMSDFCQTCCEEKSNNCIETCSNAHSLYSSNDSEELFMDVCSHKNMGTSFHGYCETFLSNKNKSEYNECFRNFCNDCCSNELKITDLNDPAISKCMKICQPPMMNSGEAAYVTPQEKRALTSNFKKI